MEKSIRVALAQIDPTVGDFQANSRKILDFIAQAKRANSDIVAFPELVLCGYPPEDLLFKKHFIKNNLEALDSLASQARDMAVIIGFVDKDNKGNLYNAAAMIQDGKVKGVYHKQDLPNYGVFDEKRYFHPGKEAGVFKLGDAVLAINICEDIWKPEGIAKAQAQMGARIFINISSSPYHAGKIALRKKTLIARARETDAYICYVNLVGGQDELVFDGASLILSPDGEIVAGANLFEEDMLIADIPLEERRHIKAKTAGKEYIILDEPKHVKKPALAKRKAATEPDKIEEIYNALVLGLGDYMRKNGFQKAVIGLSGGIDSSLVAVIAADTIGKDNVIGVSMPSRYSSAETKADARRLAQNLGLRFIEVPIDSIYNVYLLVLEKEFTGLGRDTTEENLQARIRGNILMALSNRFGWLALTTGNKSETAMGYCTLYGDMAGGFALIKDVPKTVVYEIARYGGSKEKKPLIPKSVFERAPTAELRPDQKDIDTLPPYDVLDRILREYVEEDKSLDEIVAATRFREDIVKDVIEKVDKNEYKRRQAPPGVKITPKAFGRDRRLPITNKYKDFQE